MALKTYCRNWKTARQALGMGGEDELAARHAQGILNARERIDYLLDKAPSSSPAFWQRRTAPRCARRRRRTAR